MGIADNLVSHLVELRNRLLRIAVVLLLLIIALFPFANDIYHFLAMPLLASLPAGGQMIATDVTTPFFVPMKSVLLTAFVISLPHTLYQIWAFVAPGLYTHERRLIWPLVFASTILFLCGMAFAYFLVFPVIFGFISNTAPEGVAVMTDIGNYLDFTMSLFIAFGLAFEVPVAVVLLVTTGVVSIASLREARAYVLVGAFVLGAIFTPPDVISQFMLAMPLWLLYEAGILVASLMQRTQQTSASTASSQLLPLDK
ncbi:twin-arginine translocase subunit TatC [Methylotenera mobilis]|uniref:Sec-independent protein translocase protein TatC n=1 Tax=Methylotenera mobilis (strain JLW8 / ATCC BAA-1282 / DSM 17540) TaxID=583345 RepID=C6WX35_METML|nr:twin-arginine translocase subunit TatC [Methylotenera mobilis]ACT48484.1 Sec-independent protein translocase, TatC subunit [Methylotenera mobilis JLW8]